ncbi:ESX secretion-associated protein EspG [Nocardia rhizosphaerae]|uniref:ESX secretion-associated protein EspG n=1 Tax=Nocardia rhizosphaerae TaxID=1691571 RepID=A0ABV8L9X6_9NOCA
MQRAEFTGLEFEILWSGYGRDRLPYPLQYRTDIADFGELKAQREAAVERLLCKYDPAIEHALTVLLDPDARVESKGFVGRDDAQVLRFHGAIRGNRGATLAQAPGSAADTGGDVALTFCTAGQVAALTVAALPRAKPGTTPPVEVRRERLAAEEEHFEYRAGRLSSADHLARVFRRKRRAFGEVSAFSGAAVDARPSPGRTFWWMDYDDGRYYVKTGDPIVAEPLPTDRMIAGIHRMLARAQRYHQEFGDNDEMLA